MLGDPVHQRPHELDNAFFRLLLMVEPSCLITACILARNEERRIEDALRSLQGWTDEILLIDNDSDDATVQIAERYGARILTAPRAATPSGRGIQFDAIRNMAGEHARGEWVFYLDADERVPVALGAVLRQMVRDQGSEFEALLIPFRHHFCGKWIRHSGWWPGYTRPQLLKKGCYRYNTRLHSGVTVDGRTRQFPADNPELAIVHYSFDDLTHYLCKLNNYTDAEAESLLEDGANHAWQTMLAHFVHDWQIYYDRGRGSRDGMHGFVLAFVSAFYRFASRAKLWDLRRQRGETSGAEPLPTSVREMLAFMRSVLGEGAEPWLRLRHVAASPLSVVPTDWCRTRLDAYYIDRLNGHERPSTGIAACVLARNEAGRLPEALRSLQGWADEILVLDNESTDETAEVARSLGASVVTVPTAPDFDRLRNLALEHTVSPWLLYLDADERIPAGLAECLVRLVRERGEEFEALSVPFRNYYYGKWMVSPVWWPGYGRPVLLKRGHFQYRARLHAGVEVDGRMVSLPADDPELAVIHQAYTDLRHYLEKLNRYTDEEARQFDLRGSSHSWQAQLGHFAHDWQLHYDELAARADGMHGFVQAFLCAFYRFASRAKLWDQRRQRGEVDDGEPVPASVAEMLDFMERVFQHGPAEWLTSAPAAAAPPQELPLVWRAPLFDASGYADEARNFVLALAEAGEPVAVAPEHWSDEEAGLAEAVREALVSRTVAPETPALVSVVHTLPALQRPAPGARFSVARTMFETDSLPEGWAAQLNRMDRIWVPSEFNRETFVRGGVDPDRIAVVPGALDPLPYAQPGEPWPLPGEEPFRFLSVFDWTLHKGWDVLIEAFVEEFGANPAVGLVIKTWSSNGYSFEQIRGQADAHLQARFGRSLADFPNLHLWQERIPLEDLPRLYHAAQAFVLPTRGEGWCRPLMEAMASGLPTIVTGWSGVTAYHDTRVGYPVKHRLERVSEAGAREIPIFRGQCWAEPLLEDLRLRMRQVAQNPEAAKRKGLAAQRRVAARFSRAAVAGLLRAELAVCRQLAEEKKAVVPETMGPEPAVRPAAGLPARPKANPLPRDPALPVDFQQVLGRALRVRWEGHQAMLSSLAHVNREICLGLLGCGDVELSLADRRTPWHTLTEEQEPRLAALLPREGAELSGPPDITIRHHFPPNWQRPVHGKLVVMQPWELSHLPRRDWIEGAIEHADEVWAYSRFVRDVYVRSGVPAEKVRVVPLGVQTDVFTPEGPCYPLPTRKRVRLLFVGGTIPRKGADLLLAAYLRAFTAADDVCLVVKDMGVGSYYQGQTLGEGFRQAQQRAEAPEILYLDQDLTEAELASLYRACHSIVLPYRGEGFGLAPLEGMACGLVPIVTAGGATDDYVDDVTGLRVAARRVLRPGLYADEQANPVTPWELEPDSDALMEALRWVYEHPDEARERGLRAQAAVREGGDWAHTVESVRSRCYALICPPSARHYEPARPFSASTPARAKRGAGRTVQPELSLCMIARDEEARIAECLESIAPYVDEMVVVDTGSRDRTPEIAAACGARVLQMQWPDSFAAARNQSLEHARGRWIFWMDADDVLPPEEGPKLRELIASRPELDAAWQVQVRIPPGPSEFSHSVVDHVKLFPNRPDLRFEHRIHEQILLALRRAQLDVLFSDLYVIHQNYDRSDEGQTKKRLRDFQLLQLDLADHPDHPFVLFNLGMTYLYATREFEVAAHYLRRSLDRSHPRDSIVRKAFAMLTSARMCQGEWELALLANEEGRGHYPDDAELLFQAGQIYQQRGRYAEARRSLERLIAGSDDPHYRSVDGGLRTHRGRHELALLFRRLGDGAHCAEVLREVLAQQPGYLPAQIDLAETLAGLGQTGEARTLLDQLPAVPTLAEDLSRVRAALG